MYEFCAGGESASTFESPKIIIVMESNSIPKPQSAHNKGA